MKRKKAGKKGKEKPAREEISECYFNFEIIKQYPHVRSFIMKQPLKRSFKDTFTELLGGSKKGAYRV